MLIDCIKWKCRPIYSFLFHFPIYVNNFYSKLGGKWKLYDACIAPDV